MAESNLTTGNLLTAAAMRTSESVYRSAVNWVQASLLERIALQWLRKALQSALPASESARWYRMYPNALRGATDREYELLVLADCAVELAH